MGDERVSSGDERRGVSPGGLVHSYQAYDPRRFPPPSAPLPGVANAAMEHMLRYGATRPLTDEELANAVRLDPSQIAGFGPSLDALIAMLEERKRRILQRYETGAAAAEAHGRFEASAADVREAARGVGGGQGQRGRPGRLGELREELDRALRREQIADLERLWYAAERLDRGLAGQLMTAIDALGAKYEIEQLESRYTFTGREAMGVETALALKEELEAIDRLLQQLRDARKNARVAIVDLDELARFVDEADVEQIRSFGEQIERLMREQAEMQGLERDRAGNYTLSPKTVKIFQATLLDEIFSDMRASRSGRHRGPVVGEGAVEMPRTRPYAFGDAPSHVDVTQTVVNAAARDPGGRIRPEDVEVHLTRNNPKCATCLLIDMSGSMRQMGQYVQCKRMALGLDALIRTDYPGDFLQCIEVSTFARPRHVSELPAMLPMPVTTREPVVRLRVDMADPDVSESMVHPHFTNIQHGLELARRFLAAQDTPNKQVVLITDGLPTAHFENGPGTGVPKRGGGRGDGRHLYLLYPPDPLTERATMREAMACTREGITINIFLLPSWSQSHEDVAFANRLAEQTGGRVVFTAGGDLDRFVLWDYVTRRRRVIG